MITIGQSDVTCRASAFKVGFISKIQKSTWLAVTGHWLSDCTVIHIYPGCGFTRLATVLITAAAAAALLSPPNDDHDKFSDHKLTNDNRNRIHIDVPSTDCCSGHNLFCTVFTLLYSPPTNHQPYYKVISL